MASMAPPLILLVHGTFGAESPWTFPASLLHEAISKRFRGSAQIDRQSWSGQNSPKARRAGSLALKDRLQEIFNKSPRKVVLICHSHGGNVALHARELLAAEYQQLVCVITMATPFLGRGRRFVEASTFLDIPVVEGTLVLGMLLLPIGLMFLVAPIVEWLALLLQVSPTIVVVPVFWAAAALLGCGCYLLVPWVLSWVPVFPTTALNRFNQQSLAILYSQDEAFETLSIVVNSFSLTFLAVTVGGGRIVRFLAGWNPFKLISVVALVVVVLAGAILMFSLTASKVIDAVIPRSSQAEWLANLLSEGTRLSTIVGDNAMPWIFSEWAFLVALSAFAVVIIGLMALARFTLWYLFGVAELTRSQEELLALIVGSLSISMVPEGGSEVYEMIGSAEFNHSAIYDDERTIARILRYLEQVIGDEGGNLHP
jgi:uncharacterized membrane protein (Fun14 family)